MKQPCPSQAQSWVLLADGAGSGYYLLNVRQEVQNISQHDRRPGQAHRFVCPRAHGGPRSRPLLMWVVVQSWVLLADGAGSGHYLRQYRQDLVAER